MCTTEGNKNDKVLPDPVLAIPMKSWPDKMIGKDWL